MTAEKGRVRFRRQHDQPRHAQRQHRRRILTCDGCDDCSTDGDDGVPCPFAMTIQLQQPKLTRKKESSQAKEEAPDQIAEKIDRGS